MPTIGMGIAMAYEREISAAIRSLPEERREDAWKMIHYFSEIRSASVDILLGAIVFITITCFFLLYTPLYVAIFVAICNGVAIGFYTFRTRRRLVREMNTMVANNPSYWEPIKEKLEAAKSRALMF